MTAVPVVDDQGRPIGVVSEPGLLRKQESQTDPGGHLTTAHLRLADAPTLTRSRAHRRRLDDQPGRHGTTAVVSR
ncbi:hypothetical protein [Streptomyces sp. NPDC015125]|uniref:hypothetical protein n=1 Tax=Streptomyces sp. NPDC015125 TaxID=3364938 RepID=UPI0036F87DB0